MGKVSIESLSCNKCGAPLEVPTSVDYVTCGHCGSRLAVNRTGSAHYTESLEQLSQRAARMEEDIAVLRLENEVERLDLQWEQEQEQYMVRGKDGSLSEPGVQVGIYVMIAVIGGMVLLVALLSVLSWGAAAAPFWLIALLIIGFMVYNVIDALSKSKEYEAALQSYEERKAALVQEIAAKRG